MIFTSEYRKRNWSDRYQNEESPNKILPIKLVLSSRGSGREKSLTTAHHRFELGASSSFFVARWSGKESIPYFCFLAFLV